MPKGSRHVCCQCLGLLYFFCSFVLGDGGACEMGDVQCIDQDGHRLTAITYFRAHDCGSNFTLDVRRAKQKSAPFSAFAVPVAELRDLSYFMRPQSYELFGCRVPAVPMDDAGLIHLPSTITRLKIDVGLSHNAPHSQLWLEKISNLAVFGFEPNLQAVGDLLSGRKRAQVSERWTPYFDHKFVGTQFFLFPVALGSERGHVDFHATVNDAAHSSVLEPDKNSIANMGEYDVYPVAMFPLSDLLSRIPWGFDGDPGVFAIVEHLKIDAQGHDLEVLRGAGHYLSERVVCVTAEKFTWGYTKPGHGQQDLLDFMYREGFGLLRDEGDSFTFVNLNLMDDWFTYTNDVDCSGGDLFYLEDGCLKDFNGHSYACSEKHPDVQT